MGMRTITYDLMALLKLAQAGSFTIPVFQRDFVWRDAQVRLLADSVSRNFPIGSLLVLAQSSREMPLLHSRDIRAHIRAPQVEDAASAGSQTDARSDRSYVLDGQQRLTSLVRMFLDGHDEKAYYIDLMRLIDQFNPNGSHVWHRGASELAWVRSLKRHESNPDRRERNRYIRADLVVLEPAKCQVYLQEYFEDSRDFEGRFDRSRRRQAAAAVNHVFEKIRNYQVPVVVIDPDAPLEAICRIFETINSTGTRLTTFDLAVARFFPGLDLRSLRDEAMARCPVLKRFGVDGERVLQVLVLWYALERGQSYDVARSAVLSLDPEFIRSHWSDAAACLEQAFQWAEDHGASHGGSPNEATLVALAAFLRNADPPWRLTTAFDTVLERWYFAKLLQAGSRQATNYKIGSDFRTLLDWRNTGRAPEADRVYLTPERLLELSPSDVRYRTLQALLALRARHDLKTGEVLKPQAVEDHHIFPVAVGRAAGIARKKIDSICNRLFVSAATNRFLSDQPPEQYMQEIAVDARKNRVEVNVDRRLHEAALPGSVTEAEFGKRFSVSRFDEFLATRAALILVQVQHVIGDAWVASPVVQVSGDDADEIEDDA